MFYDANEVQLSTRVDEVDSEDVAMKYRAWGWEIFDINGNDPEEIRRALDGAITVKGKPSLIIGHTLMAKGAIDKEGGRSLEDQVSTHGQPLSKPVPTFVAPSPVWAAIRTTPLSFSPRFRSASPSGVRRS